MECASPMCMFCKHCHKHNLIDRVPNCAAFPEGIPDKIFFEAADHRQPIKGDHSIMFEKKDNLRKDDRDYFNRNYPEYAK